MFTNSIWFGNIRKHYILGGFIMKKYVRKILLIALIFASIQTTMRVQAATGTTEVAVNKPFTGNLETAAEEDLYSFKTSEKGSISLSFSSAEPKKDAWKIALLDSNKIPIVEFNSSEAAIQTKEYGYPAGTYYIKVLCPYQSLYYSNVNYTINVNFATRDDMEAEYNDDYKTANTIEVNQEFSGNLYKSADVDWYSFSTKKDGFMNLELLNEYKESDSWEATLYDSNRAPIYTIMNGDIKNVTPNIGLPAGTYYVSVNCPYSSLYYSVDTYQIKVNVTASTSYETEDNSFMDMADKITLNKLTTGNLYKGSDIDYYLFTTTANGYFNLTFQNEYLKGEYYTITICKKDKTPIYSFQNGETIASSMLLGLAKGSYYVEVKCPYSFLYHTQQEYKFKINYKKSSSWESEGNDTLKTADSIILKKSKETTSGLLYGNILTATDVDCFKVNITKEQKVTFLFNHEDVGYVSYNIKIFNSKNKEVTNITNNSSSSKKTITLTKGTYYVKVSCDSSYFHSNVKYTLKVILNK